jgi:NAD(P)-dependent dehydrogenase (short-subunit alcohol dehydrogenase family)
MVLTVRGDELNDIRFDGRVAIVTGAGNGMGRDYALTLASRGASVVVNDIGVDPIRGGGSHAPADSVVEAIRTAGGKAVASYDTVATQEGGRAIAQAALDAYGRIDILIHNAAIITTGLLTDTRKEDLDSNLAVHLYGGFFVAQPCFSAMKRNGYGRIVFVSSNGIFGRTGCSAYAAAKAGLIGLMHTVALEGEPFGILCNALMPGALTRQSAAYAEDTAKEINAAIQTDAQRLEDRLVNDAIETLRKGLKPEFVTPMTLYLCSDACQTSHAIFSAIGGRYARSFLGLTRGWAASDEAPPSLTEIASHIDQIKDLDGFLVPNGVADEMVAAAEARRAFQS